jgi:magnesium chelatase subunit D
MTGAAAAGGGAPSAWSDAVTAAALLAIDPAGGGLGGLRIRAPAGPVRDRLLALFADLRPVDAPLRRVGADVDAARLDGGLDLAATLAAGRPVAAEGLLAAVAGGVLVVAMAERLGAGAAARLAAALDGPTAPFAVVALDEGLEDEPLASALADRLALVVDLSTVPASRALPPSGLAAAVAAARPRLATVAVTDEAVTALCTAAAAFGIASLRAPLAALSAARAAAALAGRSAVAAADVALAARLVLAPRALVLPAAEEDAPSEPPPPEPSSSEPPTADPPPAGMAEAPPPPETAEGSETADRPLEDVVIEAVRAALPADLLANLTAAAVVRGGRSNGRAGAMAKGGRRGRPVGIRRADPRAGDRISAYETIRAAAPWQRLRRAEADAAAAAIDGAGHPSGPGSDGRGVAAAGATGTGSVPPAATPRLVVRRDDFRAVRHARRTGTTTIFLVDASGSSALNRLGEAKGAAELLLADCYVRRDSVALIAFRGGGAELLLPPTGSLTRAKRCLAGLPGGGGTPLAAGLDAALLLADQVRRRGETPLVVLLTDGGANIGRDGTAGRAAARADAEAGARALRAAGVRALLVDTAPRPDARARSLAETMAATYLPLPNGRPEILAGAAREAARA